MCGRFLASGRARTLGQLRTVKVAFAMTGPRPVLPLHRALFGSCSELVIHCIVARISITQPAMPSRCQSPTRSTSPRARARHRIAREHSNRYSNQQLCRVGLRKFVEYITVRARIGSEVRVRPIEKLPFRIRFTTERQLTNSLQTGTTHGGQAALAEKRCFAARY